MKFSTGELELINFDSISTWNFANSDEWFTTGGEANSLWKLEPPCGEVYLYTETKVILGVSSIISSPIIIEFWIPGVAIPVRTVKYSGRSDLAIRSERVERIDHTCKEGNDLTEDYHIYSIQYIF